MAVIPVDANGNENPAALSRMAVVPIGTDGVALPGASAALSQFVAQLLQITGDTRLLFVPKSTDTTTSTDLSLNGRTLTHDATIAARLSRLGYGYKVSYTSASSQYTETPDAAGLTFGDSSTDSAFSIVVLANITDTAAIRKLITKDNTNQREWSFEVAANDVLQMWLWDNSVPISPLRASSSALATQGVMTLYGMTYSAATGGATAANDITLYSNGLVLASTATNQATYVAMEDKTAVVDIGSAFAHTTGFLDGSVALALVCQKALSANEHWAIRKLCEGYFSFLG